MDSNAGADRALDDENGANVIVANMCEQGGVIDVSQRRKKKDAIAMTGERGSGK